VEELKTFKEGEKGGRVFRWFAPGKKKRTKGGHDLEAPKRVGGALSPKRNLGKEHPSAAAKKVPGTDRLAKGLWGTQRTNDQAKNSGKKNRAGKSCRLKEKEGSEINKDERGEEGEGADRRNSKGPSLGHISGGKGEKKLRIHSITHMRKETQRALGGNLTARSDLIYNKSSPQAGGADPRLLGGKGV